MEQIKILKQNYLTILKTEGLEKLEDEIEVIDDRLKLLSNRRNRLLNSEDGRGTDLIKNTEKEISELSEKVLIAEDIAQSQYGSHLTRQQRKLTGRKFVQTEMPDGKLYWIDDYDNSDKFANDPIDCYKYRDSDLTKGPKTQQHEREVAANTSSKLDEDWDKHNKEEEKLYGPEFIDVKLYINELYKLQLAGVDKTYKCTDFVKPDKPLKEVSIESEMERAIKRRGELFREGNHRKFLAENNITEKELQALPKFVASEKVNNDKRPQAECGCGDEIAEYFINKNNAYMRVCKDCKKKGNHLVNFVCDGCKIPQMNKKFAYLNKDNQPVCSKGCL